MGHLNNQQYSISHAYVYGRVRNKLKGNITDRKNILKILRWHIRIPGPYQLIVLEEMKKAGFFKRISRDKYEILNIKEDKDAKKVIKAIMSFIFKLKEPFKQEFLNLMQKSKYIALEEDEKYQILWKNIPKDFWRNDGNPLWS